MILLLQRLQGVSLLLALCLFSTLSVALASKVWWRLVRRLRYMLLVLFALFCWQTPGTLVLPHFGGWSPTVEGCWLALDHTARILMVVAVVALMLRLLDQAQWVQGIFGLLSPFQPLGVPASRLAIRLQLVLREAERVERVPWRDMLASSTEKPEEASPPLMLSPLKTSDRLLILILFAFAGYGLLWGGVG